MTADLAVSLHAESRWRIRVGAQPWDAQAAIRAFIRDGKGSKRPPRWLTPVPVDSEEFGSTYVTNPDVPGTCVVIRNNTAITVLTRRMAKRWQQHYEEAVSVARRKAIAS